MGQLRWLPVYTARFYLPSFLGLALDGLVIVLGLFF